MSRNGPNVHIVGGDQWGEAGMFYAQGWSVVGKPEDADFLCFTGGCDIDPKFYNAKKHQYTSTNPRRDLFEMEAFEQYPDKRKIGICRGGQLLNALSGGSMFQHVDNHGRSHLAIDIDTGNTYQFSSVHHQMMIPGKDARVLAYAPGQSTFRETDTYRKTGPHDDIEALFYEKTQSFCFQPHPEWGPEDCTEYFFKKILSLYS